MAGKRGSGKAEHSRVFGHPPGRRKTPYRIGLYARVSTHDQQTLPLQTVDMNRGVRAASTAASPAEVRASRAQESDKDAPDPKNAALVNDNQAAYGFLGCHSFASRRASSISSRVIDFAIAARAVAAIPLTSTSGPSTASSNHIWAETRSCSAP